VFNRRLADVFNRIEGAPVTRVDLSPLAWLEDVDQITSAMVGVARALT